VNKRTACVVGLDLAGSPQRPTGACRLSGGRVATTILFSDVEILAYVAAARPALVTIDAPLHLPPGRSSIHDRNAVHYRPCDLELRARGIPFFPITLGPMRTLTSEAWPSARRSSSAASGSPRCIPAVPRMSGASPGPGGIPPLSGGALSGEGRPASPRMRPTTSSMPPPAPSSGSSTSPGGGGLRRFSERGDPHAPGPNRRRSLRRGRDDRPLSGQKSAGRARSPDR